MKTTVQAYDELERIIIQIHSYDNPCILKIPVEGGAADFMSWIKDTVVSSCAAKIKMLLFPLW